MGIDGTAGVPTLAVDAYATRKKVIVFFNVDDDKDNFGRSVTNDITFGSWIPRSRYVLEINEEDERIRNRRGTSTLNLFARGEPIPIVRLTRERKCNETSRTTIGHRERQDSLRRSEESLG